MRKIVIDDMEYLLDTPLRADFALVHAFLADYLGNLSFALTARNFNPVVAMAAETVIVNADHIVPVGRHRPRSCRHSCAAGRLPRSSLNAHGRSNDHCQANCRASCATGCW